MEKQIYITEHAAREALKYRLTYEDFIKIVRQEIHAKEGKTKQRLALNAKQGLLIAICAEYADKITVITLTKGKLKPERR